MGPILRQAIVYLALTSGIPPAAAITPADAPGRRLAAEDVTSRGLARLGRRPGL